jgi:N-ethylmaleimide reductase
MSVQPLFTPVRMGDLDLPNRIVMAPLTRMRAGSIDHVPTALQAEYYAQRASAGLIVAEATAISPDGFGYADTPGLWSADQVRGWRLVIDAVHAAGGRIVAQLWHTGAIAHPDVRGGSQPLSAADVDLLHESVTPSGRKPTVAPRPMTTAEIRQTVADYARAARNAMEAGFDGLEILAAYLYLIPQFLNRTTNRRTDEYGGSIENRARILFEVVEAVLEEVDPSRVGVKIGPMHDGGPMAANDETLPITEYAVRKLDGYPPGGGRVNSTRGLMHTRPINSVRSAPKPGVFDWGATVPITSCGKVEDNLPDRAAYLGHGWTAYAALTRGLPVHPGDAVFVSSGGELPRNFVDGPIIWKGI